MMERIEVLPEPERPISRTCEGDKQQYESVQDDSQLKEAS